MAFPFPRKRSSHAVAMSACRHVCAMSAPGRAGACLRQGIETFTLAGGAIADAQTAQINQHAGFEKIFW